MYKYRTRALLVTTLMTALPLSVAALEDPTQPPMRHNADILTAPDEKPVMQWNLSSILIAPNRRLAVINGRTLTLGDFIGDAQVIAIKAHAVTLKIGDEQTQLRLLPALKKTSR